MSSPLTERATPAELASRQQTIETKEIIACFPRLVEIIDQDISGFPAAAGIAKWQRFPVKIKLRFGWTHSRPEFAFASGCIKATMAALCQRCLEPFKYELGVPLSWLLLPPGVQAADSAGWEVWELDDVRLRPLDIVEETLIMALPMAAKHEDRTGCGEIAPESAERSNKVRPFAALKSQMQDLK
jgi:uncharacterized metal-binding protein YceD (DUF177 family)